MKQNIFDENLLRSFLLGELSEDAHNGLEQTALADADLLAHLQTVENDLVDEYARGELTRNEKQNFERMFLNSAERKQKIEFARAFAELERNKTVLTETEKLTPKSEPESKRKVFWQIFFPTSFKPQLVFAAITLLALLGGWLIFFDSGKRKTEIAEQKNANAALPPDHQATDNRNQITNNSSISPTASPTAEASPAPEKPNQNKQNNAPPIRPKQTATPAIKDNPPAQNTFAVLVFPIGMTRDEGGKVLQLKLPANVKNARLVFNLEKGDEYKSYQVRIRKGSDPALLNINARHSGRAVTVNLPAERLTAGNYEAVLRGSNDNEQSETIGYYNFKIIKP